MTNKKTPEQLPKKNQMDKILPLLFHQEGKLKSILKHNSIRKLAVAVLMLASSMLPYSDMLLDIFVDTKNIQVPRFQNLSYAIWAYATPLSAMMVLLISKVFNPPKWTYIAMIYVNLSQILAYIYLQCDIEIESDWLFRLINLLFSVILFFLATRAVSIYQTMKCKDDLMEEFLKERNRYEQEDC